jgi:hypothetical protein
MQFDGYLFSGTRCWNMEAVLAIDLWSTEDQAEITLSDENANRKVLLDPDESRVIRDWAAAVMQCGIVSSQGCLLEMRCDLQEQLIRARKLNRAASRAASRARKQPAKVAKAASVVDINVWRRAAEQPAVELALAA